MDIVCKSPTCKVDWVNTVASGIDIWTCCVCQRYICDVCFKKRSWKRGNGFDERANKHCSPTCAAKTRNSCELPRCLNFTHN